MIQTSLSRFRTPAILAAGALFVSLSLPASAQPGTALANLATPSATAGPRARTPEADTSTSADSGERRICVREEITGSRMRRRVCKTAREWEAAGGIDQER